MMRGEDGHTGSRVGVTTNEQGRLSITTAKGITYQNCRLTRAEPDGLSFTHSKGIAKIPFWELPPAFAKEHGYDPKAARHYSSLQAEKRSRYNQLRERPARRDDMPSLGSRGTSGELATTQATRNDGRAAWDRGRQPPTPGRAWESPRTGMEFVWIDALRAWVGKYEVTNGEYERFKTGHCRSVAASFNNNPFFTRSKRHARDFVSYPVASVSFEDAKRFAAWVTSEEHKAGTLPAGHRYRLPSEKEWSTYARCGDGRKYPWGNTWPPPNTWNYGEPGESRGLFGESPDMLLMMGIKDDMPGRRDKYQDSCPVRMSGVNSWGLYGVGGNVSEACATDESGASFGAWRGASFYDRQARALECAWREYDRKLSVVIGQEPVEDSRKEKSTAGFRLLLSP